MGELELLAAISKKISRSKAYKFVKHGEHQPFIHSSNGTAQARKTVSYYFELRPEHIVHHEDRDEGNNDPRNLKVFASNGDHFRYHEQFPVNILWDGATATIYKIGKSH